MPKKPTQPKSNWDVIPADTPMEEIVTRVMKGVTTKAKGKRKTSAKGKVRKPPKKQPQAVTGGGGVAEKNKAGRPCSFTPQVGDAICQAMMEGQSLREICAAEGMPGMATVMRWLADGNIALQAGKTEDNLARFREQYAHAREVQADVLADETMTIADDGRNDWMEKFNKDGESIGWTVNGEATRRSQIRIDARKWYVEKLNPKKYAPMQKHADADGEKLPSGEINDLDLARRIAFVLAQAQKKV